MNLKKGFTLIELLVVIAIIAILSAIIVPAIIRAKEGAYRNADIANMNAIRSALQQYKVDQGGFPPALLGYVTTYTSGPNIGQVIPADKLSGFLYSKRIGSLETLRPAFNRVATNLTTTAVWPGTTADSSNCSQQAFDRNTAGFVADVRQTGGNPTPVNNANQALQFYQVSGYDVAKAFGPGNVEAFELRYSLFWSGYGLNNGTCGAGNAQDDPRQLGYDDPPETTVITWNSFFRGNRTVPPARGRQEIVLFLGGAARPADPNSVYQLAWRTAP